MGKGKMSEVALVQDPAVAMVQVNTMPERPRSDAAQAVILGCLLGLVVGCTAIHIEPVESGVGLTHVCIKEDPKVIVPDFLTILRAGFRRHRISSEMYTDAVPTHCEFTLTYTALQSWDMVSYLSHAELRLEHRGDQIAYATYHLRNRGGYALYSKWKSTRTKMDPVIDRLLGAYPPRG